MTEKKSESAKISPSIMKKEQRRMNYDYINGDIIDYGGYIDDGMRGEYDPAGSNNCDINNLLGVSVNQEGVL